jgi:uncharacterized protein (TIGR03083 family)
MTNQTDSRYDAIVVGARVGGSTAATRLANAGWRVLLVDRDRFPSDTVSTHQIFPHGLQVLEELGALDRLRAAHQLRPLRYSWRVLDHEVAGGFSPVGGHDRMYSVRRTALDAALVETAVAAGAELRTGMPVRDLLGAGTLDDPARGVVLADGSEVTAGWVIGADGRTSIVARRLGLDETDQRRGDLAMLYSYWTGLPDSGWCRIDAQSRRVLMSSPCEDGVHLLVVSGPAELSRGSAEQRQAAYLDALHRFPAVLDAQLLDDASQVGPVVSVPETMMRGFRRLATGPGWALVGDAGLYKHPATGQGISDALTQSRYVGTALAEHGHLADFQAWRDAQDAGHYEFSFVAATFATPKAAATYAGLAADQTAGQEFLDLFTKRTAPQAVLSRERVDRWRTAWTYEQGLHEVAAVIGNPWTDVASVRVPACPDWTVADLLAHLVGVATDSAASGFFAKAMDAWRNPTDAAARERWTSGHVREHAQHDLERLLSCLQARGARLVDALRRGTPPVAGSPDWGSSAPLTDLSVHVADLREALGRAADTGSPVSRWGFAAYRSWLHLRLLESGLPALTLRDGEGEWTVGDGPPVGSVTAERYELFRMVSGRRSADRITAYDWTTDPAPYLPVIAPYPLPA